jgi:hypothetical protein
MNLDSFRYNRTGSEVGFESCHRESVAMPSYDVVDEFQGHTEAVWIVSGHAG